MGSTIHRSDLKLIRQLFFAGEMSDDYIISTKTLSKPRHRSVSFQYINNPDGTIRWIFPKGLTKPTYLSFYNATGIKARFLRVVLTWLHRLRCHHWIVSGEFTLYFSKPLALQWEDTFDHYTIFTGTTGPNRKVLIELNKGGKTISFVKVPISDASAALIQNEKSVLQQLRSFDLKKWQLPNAEPHPQYGIFSNLKNKHSVTSNEFTPIHADTLVELYQVSASKQELRTVKKVIKDKLDGLVADIRFPKCESVIQLMYQLLETIPAAGTFMTSLAHKDFTPWNGYVNGSQLSVYDWELAEHHMPVLYDLFHFLFQSGVLIKHQSFPEIHDALIEVLEMDTVKQYIREHEIDVTLHLKLYLLINTCYYLDLYRRQSHLHVQAGWLVECWHVALENLMARKTAETHRQFFLSQFAVEMKDRRYGLLKFLHEKLTDLPENSDIDLVMDRRDVKSVFTWIRSQQYIQQVITRHKSFMTTVEIFFQDNTYLSLDFIYQFKRKHWEILPAEEVLDHCISVGAVKCVHPKHDLAYILLFYRLNGSDIPNRYMDKYLGLDKAEQDQLSDYLSASLQIGRSTLAAQLFETTPHELLQVMRVKNQGFKSIMNKFHYAVDVIKDRMLGNGFVITFSGVDGAGKTTVIERVKSELRKKYRKQIVYLRHRPSLLPILSAYKYGRKGAEQRSVDALPRSGNNTSFVSSIARFSYYLLDYLIGQFIVKIKYTMRGKIVLYDRYYYDFISDAKRTNIVLPKWIMKACCRLIIKPKFNFFLYAKPGVILARKQELNADTITSLTQEYSDLFRHYDRQYKKSVFKQIENNEISQTLEEVMKTIQAAA